MGSVLLGLADGLLLADFRNIHVADEQVALADAGVQPGWVVEFRWRGRKEETGRSLKGKCMVLLYKDRILEGYFDDMDSKTYFDAKPKTTPEGSSGRGTAYYLRGWDDYRPAVNSDVE